jgi:hypothetical protein
MPFSRETVEYFSRRNKRLEFFKAKTKIGIFGSFSESRKPGLLALKQYLRENGYDALISEDLDKRPVHERRKRDPAYDRKSSEQLIRESDVHIFILPQEHDEETANLAQSVSMEIERLHTLSECGQKSEKYVAVFAETGLIGTMGGVCEGLLLSKEGGWTIEEYQEIEEIFKPARQFCMNCIQDMYIF